MIVNADALRIPLINDCVQTVVTSPPYYHMRNYGMDNQIGREATPEEYVMNLVFVFREVRRVLKKDGTLWLNLGDCYAAAGGTGEAGSNSTVGSAIRGYQGRATTPKNLKSKDLIGIPWRVAFALQADGWYLRMDNIWNKPNSKPESVTDRPTRVHEYVFLLSKSRKYYFDQDAVREPYTAPMNRWGGENLVAKGKSEWDKGTGQSTYRSRNMRPNPAGRNIRSVWTIATKPNPYGHFATFPDSLVEPCILAGSRVDDVVLDPFAGSGTVEQVAALLGRRSFGCELDFDCIRGPARKRLSRIQPTFQIIKEIGNG